MALHINLYHEIQKQRQLQRRDPLKLSLFGLGAIAVLFAGFYGIQLGRTHGINSELAKAKAAFDKIEPEAKAAKKRGEEASAGLELNSLLAKRIEDRFHWAPMLEQLMQVVPREVQITRFAGDIAGDGLRKCQLTIDGLSAGSDARRVAEDLRTAITDKLASNPKYKNVTSNFKALDDGAESVNFEGQQLPTATFAINLVLNTGEEPPPPPTPRKKKGATASTL